MLKTVFKEIIITLLLCIAILLVLSILFYDYNPLNKIVPNKIAYTTPENIQNELDENEVKDIFEGGVNIVYSIDGSDLNIYKKSNSYVSGKANPFGEIVDTPTGGDTTTPNNNLGDTTNQNKETTITNTNPDSTGTFLNNTGSK